ncbi:hypothetical protein [Mycobacterium branderi]|uniref:hypothetical protein n=1 Tax=Mycobacterium branderi TaxID=43348 RepID=UPI00111BF90A|nr:hypothetical protein [Mycobacterium branderi]MCV7236382.1 hypothetical protein [Mycobacterium branderi]
MPDHRRRLLTVLAGAPGGPLAWATALLRAATARLIAASRHSPAPLRRILWGTGRQPHNRDPVGSADPESGDGAPPRR